MNSNKKLARRTGIVYLIVVITGIFSLLYIPEKLFEWNDPTKTYENILSNNMLFRLGIVAEIICYLFFLILPFMLYKLLKHVHKQHAILMVVFVMVGVPLSMAAIFYKVDILSLLNEGQIVNSMATSEIETRLMFSLDSYYNGMLISEIFWGLWLFPFGLLVYKSKILPKFFGIFLMLGCIGYLLEVFGGILCKDYSTTLFSTIVAIPSAIGEIGICLWLLIMGAKENPIPND